VSAAHRVLVTGGAGYIGSVLCPKLLAAGHAVCVLDLLFFGLDPIEPLLARPGFTLIEGDIRDRRLVERTLGDGAFDRVVHLAAISNDPSSELDEGITLGVNLDATCHLMETARQAGVGRFLFASSASVYGIKDEPDVHEGLALEPITLYARCKAEGEAALDRLLRPGFEGVSLRAATVCGDSPRLRLDLTVNILTCQAVCEGRIRVFGGSQLRPNLHIEDLTDLYVRMLDAPCVSGARYNVCRANASVRELAEMVRGRVDPRIPIEAVPTSDLRSYHLSGARLARELGFQPARGLEQAVDEVSAALRSGRVTDPQSSRYRNVAHMQRNLAFWRRAKT
jgi:nucleoside-diphosphate-sugar epimerase